MKIHYSRLLLFYFLVGYTHQLFSQTKDSIQTTSPATSHFSGAVSVTNNGISLLPTFALGKPAVIFDMSVGKKKLSFEPQFRFSLEGKPWSLLFWWRYKLLETKRFRLNVGAHPAIAFKTVLPTPENPNELLVSKRFLAGEIAPSYALTKNSNVGLYYLHSHGFDTGVTKTTHFLAVRGSLSNISLSRQFSLRIDPQLYYLNLDNADGIYMASTFTIARKGFPLSLQSIVNKTIQTNIAASKDVVWNVSLVYSFHKNYAGI